MAPMKKGRTTFREERVEKQGAARWVPAAVAHRAANPDGG